jgi:hypothetical protein
MVAYLPCDPQIDSTIAQIGVGKPRNDYILLFFSSFRSLNTAK